MTSDLSERVAQLLRTRREQLLQVKAENAWWLGIDRNLTEIPAALDELRRHPSVSPDDALGPVVSHLQEIRADISGVIETYSAVEARFSRETVNIGVSGSARVGKSTLLQSISGLTDEQIPTGRDIPVTAVRSRIYHSPGCGSRCCACTRPRRSSTRPSGPTMPRSVASRGLSVALVEEDDFAAAPLGALPRLCTAGRGVWNTGSSARSTQ